MRAAFLAGLALLALAAPAGAQEEPAMPKQSWSFDGPFGTYDRAAVQRGFEVYNEVCSHCHSMNLLHYRDLSGIGYSEDEIKAIAAQQAGDRRTQRPGRDVPAPRPAGGHIRRRPFPTSRRRAPRINGALPPDLSLIIKAREGGADYVYAHAAGLQGSARRREDGRQHAVQRRTSPAIRSPCRRRSPDNDVTICRRHQGDADRRRRMTSRPSSAWAAEPTMEERKRTGAKVLIFLLVMTGVLYAAKRQIWAELH